jgi:hypothetical protein
MTASVYAPRCALCGRVTLMPAVVIGAEPVGPKCARRAGLLAVSRRAGSRVLALAHTGKGRSTARGDNHTLDLFPGDA